MRLWKGKEAAYLQILTILFCFLHLPGCVRIYVASPDVFSFREPPSIKTAQVITDLRMIGTTLEAHMVDHNTYPAIQGTDVVAGALSFAYVERLEAALKNYGRHLPAQDPWGNPYLYWYSGNVYMLASTGSDRMIANETDIQQIADMIQKGQVFIKRKVSDCLQDEIIFSGGQFLQSPNHASKECSR